jgi:hypothetical protein
MQLRYAIELTAEEYVKQKAWKKARLDACPLHPEGGCGYHKNGTYERKTIKGMKIPRWYCKKGHTSFSLLPDCLASRIPSTLIDIETVVDQVENAKAQEAATKFFRLDVGQKCILRWIRRRLFLVRENLTLVINLLPSLFKGCVPSPSSFRSVLDVEYALPALRQIAAPYLEVLPPPLGFGPRSKQKNSKILRFQQRMGTDPP